MRVNSTALFTLFQPSVLALPAPAEPSQEYDKADNKTRNGPRAFDKAQYSISETNILSHRSIGSDSTTIPTHTRTKTGACIKSLHRAV